MSNPNESFFSEWRTADRSAHALEQALTRASMAALEGRGEPPDPADREKAKKLRQIADDLFQLAG